MNKLAQPASSATCLPQELRKAIVIVGSPRSGTTMLGRTLAHHSQVALLGEPRMTWRYGNDRKSDRLTAADARPEVVNYIRGRFAEHVRAHGKPRLLEKSPQNAIRLDFVERVLPGCKIIHTIRHGVQSALAIQSFWKNKSTGVTTIPRDKVGRRLREVGLRRLPYYGREVARRLLGSAFPGWVAPNIWGTRIPGIDELVKDLDLIEVCALQWRMSVEAARHHGQGLPPDRYMEYRLEDISPELIERVLAFCELEPEQAVMDYLRAHYDPARQNRRIDEADPRDVERIRQWIEPTLHWLGYE